MNNHVARKTMPKTGKKHRPAGLTVDLRQVATRETDREFVIEPHTLFCYLEKGGGEGIVPSDKIKHVGLLAILDCQRLGADQLSASQENKILHDVFSQGELERLRRMIINEVTYA